MKKFFHIFLLIMTFCCPQLLFAQSYDLRAPKQGAIYQRNASNLASVPIAGQISNITSSSNTVTVTAKRVDGNGNIIANAPIAQATLNAPNGIYNGTITLTKGWYQFTQVFSTGGSIINYAGVGDVFVIAGQSNGQGASGLGFTNPSTSSTPEFIRGMSGLLNCEKRFVDNSNSIYPLSFSANISPTGVPKWCYEALGKKISDANADNYSGMPVLFFNTAAGGSTVKNWSDGADGLRACIVI